jgi:hypothetical protein
MAGRGVRRGEALAMLARTLPLALLVVAALPLAPWSGPLAMDDSIPRVPCADPRGCPDMVVDSLWLPVGVQETENFPPTHCDVQDGFVPPGERQLLRFSYNTPNAGDGALVIGAPRDHPEWFYWAPCHRHYHYREFADYRLWTVEGFLAWELARVENPDLTAEEVLAAHPELRDGFVSGRKTGFCVIDLLPALPTALYVALPPDPRTFTSCTDNQGLGRGWADMYIWTTSGQYIDVTGVPSGPYVLEVEVNAERFYVETDYANNRAFIPVVVAEQL